MGNDRIRRYPGLVCSMWLFRQFHRDERDVYDNIAFLVRARNGSAPPERNVPNKYLAE